MKKINPKVTPKSATLNSRFCALLIDSILLVSCVYYSIYIYKLPIPEISMAPLRPDFITALYFYFILTVLPQSIFSQTIGQMLAGIKVVNQAHRRLKFFPCLFRAVIFRPISLLTFWTFFTQNKGLHDKIVGAKVVRAS